MKNVLISAPQFVPVSYPPAHRIRLFTNHLEEWGWKPIVMGVDPQFCEEELDWEFARLIPETLEIIRTRAIPVSWTRRFGMGDVGLRCFYFHWQLARRLCRERSIDLLFLPGPPWFMFLLGPLIKKEFGVPFVMDYIDPWVSSAGQGEPPWRKSFWFRQAALWLEPGVVRKATRITSVSEGINQELLQRYPFLKPDHLTSIRYGAEPSDFDFLREHPRPHLAWNSSDGLYHIACVGVMAPKGYETLRAVCRALRRLRDEGWAPEMKLRMHFIGTNYAAHNPNPLILSTADTEGVPDLFTEHPARVPYLDAMNILCSSDALLAMGTTEHDYAASKLFSCLLAGRPLLGIFHEATSPAPILRELRPDGLVTYSDARPALSHVDEIAAVIRRFVNAGQMPDSSCFLSLFDPYLARSTTQTLTRVFDEAISP